MSNASGGAESQTGALLPPSSQADLEPRSVFITAPDGLRLHVREYGSRAAQALPVVCLPGLSRNSADFHELAGTLSSDPKTPRRVLAVDYRGRGLSDYDPDPENYTTATELADVVAALTALEIGRAVFIGTSRGGIITMLMAATRPSFIAGAVLNDIGPVIETKGLLRIKGYLGKLPQPRNWAEAADILRRIFATQFPSNSGEDWQHAARLTWREQSGQWVLNYDAKLASTLDALDIDAPTPSLWPQFDALGRVPLLVIRGGLSDLLSKESLTAMQARRPGIEIVEIADEGHPPSLARHELMERIANFLRTCDRVAHIRVKNAG